ncbi:DUF2283 domain-containing protein [Moorella sp. ACPs]|uniref:DUF2283 domain-containing protein n=1 Tax=Neomoorella carbonis TaxID=3062783 RepID=UPI003251E6CD
MTEAMSYIKLAEAVSQTVVGSGLPLLRVSYDPAGDVLYVHFTEQPVAADDSEFVGDDTVVRYRGSEVVVVTILRAGGNGEKREGKGRQAYSGHKGRTFCFEAAIQPSRDLIAGRRHWGKRKPPRVFY